MKDVLLFACVLLAFLLGYFPMRRLDRLLAARRPDAEEERENVHELCAKGEERRPRAGAKSVARLTARMPLRHRV